MNFLLILSPLLLLVECGEAKTVEYVLKNNKSIAENNSFKVKLTAEYGVQTQLNNSHSKSQPKHVKETKDNEEFKGGVTNLLARLEESEKYKNDLVAEESRNGYKVRNPEDQLDEGSQYHFHYTNQYPQLGSPNSPEDLVPDSDYIGQNDGYNTQYDQANENMYIPPQNSEISPTYHDQNYLQSVNFPISETPRKETPSHNGLRNAVNNIENGNEESNMKSKLIQVPAFEVQLQSEAQNVKQTGKISSLSNQVVDFGTRVVLNVRPELPNHYSKIRSWKSTDIPTKTKLNSYQMIKQTKPKVNNLYNKISEDKMSYEVPEYYKNPKEQQHTIIPTNNYQTNSMPETSQPLLNSVLMHHLYQTENLGDPWMNPESLRIAADAVKEHVNLPSNSLIATQGKPKVYMDNGYQHPVPKTPLNNAPHYQQNPQSISNVRRTHYYHNSLNYGHEGTNEYNGKYSPKVEANGFSKPQALHEIPAPILKDQEPIKSNYPNLKINTHSIQNQPLNVEYNNVYSKTLYVDSSPPLGQSNNFDQLPLSADNGNRINLQDPPSFSPYKNVAPLNYKTEPLHTNVENIAVFRTQPIQNQHLNVEYNNGYSKSRYFDSSPPPGKNNNFKIDQLPLSGNNGDRINLQGPLSSPPYKNVAPLNYKTEPLHHNVENNAAFRPLLQEYRPQTYQNIDDSGAQPSTSPYRHIDQPSTSQYQSTGENNEDCPLNSLAISYPNYPDLTVDNVPSFYQSTDTHSSDFNLQQVTSPYEQNLQYKPAEQTQYHKNVHTVNTPEQPNLQNTVIPQIQPNSASYNPQPPLAYHQEQTYHQVYDPYSQNQNSDPSQVPPVGSPMVVWLQQNLGGASSNINQKYVRSPDSKSNYSTLYPNKFSAKYTSNFHQNDAIANKLDAKINTTNMPPNVDSQSNSRQVPPNGQKNLKEGLGYNQQHSSNGPVIFGNGLEQSTNSSQNVISKQAKSTKHQPEYILKNVYDGSYIHMHDGIVEYPKNVRFTNHHVNRAKVPQNIVANFAKRYIDYSRKFNRSRGRYEDNFHIENNQNFESFKIPKTKSINREYRKKLTGPHQVKRKLILKPVRYKILINEKQFPEDDED